MIEQTEGDRRVFFLAESNRWWTQYRSHTLVNESRFSLDRSDFGQGQQAVQYSAAQAQEAGVEVEVAVTHFAQANVLLLVPQASSTYRTSVKVRGHSYSMQH